MLEGLAARFIIKQKQIFTLIHIICLFSFRSLSGAVGKQR